MLQACSGQKGDPEYIFCIAIGEEMSELQEKYFRTQKPANFEKKKTGRALSSSNGSNTSTSRISRAGWDCLEWVVPMYVVEERQTEAATFIIEAQPASME